MSVLLGKQSSFWGVKNVADSAVMPARDTRL